MAFMSSFWKPAGISNSDPSCRATTMSRISKTSPLSLTSRTGKPSAGSNQLVESVAGWSGTGSISPVQRHFSVARPFTDSEPTFSELR